MDELNEYWRLDGFGGGTNKMLKFYFSGDGRINRTKFALFGALPILLLTQALQIVVATIPHIKLPINASQQPAMLLILLGVFAMSLCLAITLYWALGCLTAKRAHDLNTTGRWGARIVIIGIAHLLTFCLLIFGLPTGGVSLLCFLGLLVILATFIAVPGSKGCNKYGPPQAPSPKKHVKAFE